MSINMQIPMLYTATEFAEVLGVKPTSLRRSVARGSLPQPDGHLERTPYWHYDTVQYELDRRTK